MSQKNTLLAIIVFIIAGGGYFWWAEQQETAPKIDLTSKDQQELQSMVFAAVDAKTAGEWDKKIEIAEIDQSKSAVKGKWISTDYWDWLAWHEDGGQWKVLVSLDGFDCQELETVPSDYNDFFQNVIYAPSGDKYCYSHASRVTP